jgi:hypothetical protein
VRWKRVLIGAVLGGVLGFAGQLVLDFFCWAPSGSETVWRCIDSGEISHHIARFMPKHEHAALELWYQLVFLWWLNERGQTASQTVLIVAFLGASAALALKKKGRASAVKTSAKQTCIGAAPVAEPKDSALNKRP